MNIMILAICIIINLLLSALLCYITIKLSILWHDEDFNIKIHILYCILTILGIIGLWIITYIRYIN